MTNFADLYKDAILLKQALMGQAGLRLMEVILTLAGCTWKGLLTEYDKALMDFEEDLTVESFEADKRHLLH